MSLLSLLLRARKEIDLGKFPWRYYTAVFRQSFTRAHAGRPILPIFLPVPDYNEPRANHEKSRAKAVQIRKEGDLLAALRSMPSDMLFLDLN